MTEYDKAFILLVSDEIVYTKNNMNKIVHTREEDTGNERVRKWIRDI